MGKDIRNAKEGGKAKNAITHKGNNNNVEGGGAAGWEKKIEWQNNRKKTNA